VDALGKFTVQGQIKDRGVTILKKYSASQGGFESTWTYSGTLNEDGDEINGNITQESGDGNGEDARTRVGMRRTMRRTRTMNRTGGGRGGRGRGRRGGGRGGEEEEEEEGEGKGKRKEEEKGDEEKSKLMPCRGRHRGGAK
jgi:hypothetical protein